MDLSAILLVVKCGSFFVNLLLHSADKWTNIVINAAVNWQDKTLDEFVLEASKRFIGRATEMGKEMGAYHDYKYMNYASQEQDVFAGYGEENRRKLREIQKKYDVKDVFHRLQAGYFKV